MKAYISNRAARERFEAVYPSDQGGRVNGVPPLFEGWHAVDEARAILAEAERETAFGVTFNGWTLPACISYRVAVRTSGGWNVPLEAVEDSRAAIVDALRAFIAEPGQ